MTSGSPGLADVEHLLHRPHGVVVELDDLSVDLDHPLRGQHFEVLDADGIEDTRSSWPMACQRAALPPRQTWPGSGGACPPSRAATG